VILWALRQELPDETAREKLLERLGLAIIWGQEAVDGPSVRLLLELDREDDLAILARFFWSVSEQKLTAEDVHRIIDFWSLCLDWATRRATAPASLLSSLCLLSCYIRIVDERAKCLLLAVAPYVSAGHNANEFIEDLDKLATDNAPVQMNDGAWLRQTIGGEVTYLVKNNSLWASRRAGRGVSSYYRRLCWSNLCI
jgi:hypothetical protein